MPIYVAFHKDGTVTVRTIVLMVRMNLPPVSRRLAAPGSSAAETVDVFRPASGVTRITVRPIFVKYFSEFFTDFFP